MSAALKSIGGIAPALRGGAMSMRSATARTIAVAAVLVLAACNSRSEAPLPAPAPPPEPAPAPARATHTGPPRLPEDPAAGERSTRQWREHLDHEEHERQMWFDGPRVAEHRAVVKLIARARARYDRAGSEAALAKARAQMPRAVEEIRGRVTKIDPWGNNSPLLPHYHALSTSLTAAYADAKLAALRGDPRALDAARADFDRRTDEIDDWLVRAEREHEHGEGAGEAEQAERESAERAEREEHAHEAR